MGGLWLLFGALCHTLLNAISLNQAPGRSVSFVDHGSFLDVTCLRHAHPEFWHVRHLLCVQFMPVAEFHASSMATGRGAG